MLACTHMHTVTVAPSTCLQQGRKPPASQELTGQDAPRNRSGDAFPLAGAGSREGGDCLGSGRGRDRAQPFPTYRDGHGSWT